MPQPEDGTVTKPLTIAAAAFLTVAAFSLVPTPAEADFIFILLSVGALLNGVATLLVCRSAIYAREQKKYQVILIWAVPIFGALLCLLVLYYTFRRATPTRRSESNRNAIPMSVGSYSD
jgi:NADH:ubiquinone oxidoreductase subunit K